MANPGYGKRSAPEQRPGTPQDFALLPVRERYVAGFVDHLPEGAAMSVKQLAKQLSLYGQQAVSSALTALSVAGHLRRVRCPVGAGDEMRWVFRTFWSRTAHDNEWWTTYLATETATQAAGPEPEATTPPPWVPEEEPSPAPEDPGPEQGHESTAVPQQRTPDQAPDAEPPPPDPDTAPAAPQAPEAGPSTAYLALARLGRNDHRLALSADDCAALEAQAAEWLARGVSVDYLTSALTAGLPAKVDSPVGLLRRRLTDKMPPRLPAEDTAPDSPAPTARRVLMECTDCGRPGHPEALPDGLCRPCRTTHNQTTAETPDHPGEAADIKTHMTNLRDLLRTV
ncbi:MarR family transcriptional regulator [Streptomyces cyaneofuscatus]|uniref:MarR family transcriptional regulator n=1 Tax=Streptomyces cyaneofuscatus TaxID=66883 RepID=A0ABZ1F7I2_9ACTN|nr:MarR family transcriptional regulator [Streptomyces cyaneofuscatus]WSB12393.1 MarR family transcriptional regulator [Streptomyces cyaneofuscatus]WSD50917.1 MarR family transcriptional regulator [Streptomyces cyaneofuscatus]